MEQRGIPQAYLGLRNWLKYDEPFKFNIAVNDMSDVARHEDAELPRNNNYSVQSSAANWNYNLVTTGKSKRL